MKVFWTADAIQDRLDIWEYISLDNQDAASNMDQLFSIAATWLSDY